MENYAENWALKAQIEPVLAQLEAERLLIVNRNYTIMAISAGILFGGALIAFDLESLPFLIGGTILALINYFVFSDKGAGEWSIIYKQQVINAIVKSFFGEQGKYEPQNGHTETVFIGTALFDHTPDSYHSEDLITGMVDKTFISFSEVNAQYKTEERRTDSKGNSSTHTTWHTIFKGILFTADFNKQLKGRTIVKEKGFWSFGTYGNIELENPEFKETFAVLADDPIEARYILSLALMEKILQLNKSWGGLLGFSFVGPNLTIAIPFSVNFFEISVSDKIDGHTTWQRDWEIIGDMISMVHELDLNTRIWTKE
jgi:hypothetical protein